MDYFGTLFPLWLLGKKSKVNESAVFRCLLFIVRIQEIQQQCITVLLLYINYSLGYLTKRKKTMKMNGVVCITRMSFHTYLSMLCI